MAVSNDTKIVTHAVIKTLDAGQPYFWMASIGPGHIYWTEYESKALRVPLGCIQAWETIARSHTSIPIQYVYIDPEVSDE